MTQSGTPADSPLTPGAPGGTPTPVPTPTPAVAAPEPVDKDKIVMSSEQLKERLKRDRSSYLKDLGFDSEEQAKKFKEDAENARKAQMTKEQQLEEENAKLKRERDEATAARAAAEFDSTLVQRCAERGIRDVDYARYLVSNGGTIPDVGAFLDEALKDARRKISLGVEEVPPKLVTTPVITTPLNPNAPPPAPGPATPANGVVDVMKMTKAESDAYMRKQYGA